MKICPWYSLIFYICSVLVNSAPVVVPKSSKCSSVKGSTRSVDSTKAEDKKINLIQDLKLLSQQKKRTDVPDPADCNEASKRDEESDVDSSINHESETLLPSGSSVEPISGVAASAVRGVKKYKVIRVPQIVDEDSPGRGSAKSATLLQQGKGVVRSSLSRPDSVINYAKITPIPTIHNLTLRKTVENATDASSEVSQASEAEQKPKQNEKSEKAETTEAQNSRLVTNVLKNTSRFLSIEENVEDANDVIGSKRTVSKPAQPKERKEAVQRSSAPLPKKITPEDTNAAAAAQTGSGKATVPVRAIVETQKRPSPTIVKVPLLNQGRLKAAPMRPVDNSTRWTPAIKNDSFADLRNVHSINHILDKAGTGVVKSTGTGIVSTAANRPSIQSNSASSSKPSSSFSSSSSSSSLKPAQTASSNSQAASTKTEAPKMEKGSGASLTAPALAAPSPPAPPPDPYAEIANGPDSPKLPELKTSGEGVNSPLMKVDTENGPMHTLSAPKTEPPVASSETPSAATPAPSAVSGQTDVGGLLDSLTDKLNSGGGPGEVPAAPPEPMEAPEPHPQTPPQQDVGGLLDTLTDKLNLGGNIATDQPIPSREAKYLQDQLNQYDQQAIMQAQGYNNDKSMKNVKAPPELQSAPEPDPLMPKAVPPINPNPVAPMEAVNPVNPPPPGGKTWNDLNTIDSLNAEATREEPTLADNYGGELESYAAPQPHPISDAIAPSQLSAAAAYGQQAPIAPSYSRQTLDAATQEDINYEQQIAGGGYNGATFGNTDTQAMDAAQESYEGPYQGQYLRRNTILRPPTYDYEQHPYFMERYLNYV